MGNTIMTADVALKKISKSFVGTEKKGEKAHQIHVLKDISITVENGEFLVLVGPSGCGKSTLLRIIAGLDEQTHGEVWIANKCVNDVSPKDRDVAMVFQNYALYPHMTVFDNLAFALKMRKVPKAEILKRVEKTAHSLELTHLLKRKPRELSGGQRQRVALGRAIIRNPQVFLMDEPLSNLDARLRAQTRLELQNLHHTYKTTTIYVTHDQVEAMTLGHRVAVMHQGIIQQIDKPNIIYRSPANRFVGQFIGQMNFIEAHYDAGKLHLDAGGEIPLPTSITQKLEQAAFHLPEKGVHLGIRPEHFTLQKRDDASAVYPLTIEPELVESLGKEKLIYGHFAGATVAVELPGDYEQHGPLNVYLDLEKTSYFCKSTGKNLIS